MVKSKTQQNATIIELTPNRSASWRDVKILLIAIGLFVMLIATAWAFVGVWVILPFAGFEVGLLALLMYKVSLRCHNKQVITISKEKVVFECGIKSPEFVWRFNRAETHLAITEATARFDRPQMVLTDDNVSIELGDFLNQSDCELARDTFKQAGIVEVSNHWWKR
ncbi:DUF2244 domain-containing protein [Aliiglaciecola sp. M165]|uniref:DUF2244 domain-containing protein n=1 Tax=Aliiglaciecola sp. M165 TaxID=2593649 RepID=UPI00117C367F|nr:DUF2244 domain-containing protein [Aliiglaciecola sp. M165]TRY29319.1 DUF2244 domain-containing protein [Aliiglaciecola sp. M165]